MNIDQRVEECRCIACNHVVVDAWFCDECAFSSELFDRRNQDDRPSTTATKIGRAQQLRVDQAAAHEQLIQIQTVLDSGVIPVESEGHSGPSPTHHGRRKDVYTSKRLENRTAVVAPVLSESNRSRRIREMLHAASSPGLTIRERREAASKVPSAAFNPYPTRAA